MKPTLSLLLLSFGLALASFDSFWTQDVASDPSTLHTVFLGVNLVDGAAQTCDTLLNSVSDPESPKYGAHLSFEDMKMFTDMNSLDAAYRWLAARLPETHIHPSPNGDWIVLRSTTGALESAFDCTFYDFVSTENPSVRIARAVDFHAPTELAKHVEVISNFQGFPAPPSRFAKRLRAPTGTGDVSPKLLNSYYNVSSNAVASNKSTDAVFEALGQSFSPADLSQFQKNFGLPNVPVRKVIGPNDPSSCQANQNNCAEASLDVQWITAMAQTEPTFWAIDSTIQDIFVTWVVAVASDSTPPLVHSISYGSLAPEDGQSNKERFNTEVCKLGTRGLSVLVSSGDDGTANFEHRGQSCEGGGYTPSFPATSPYVTAVGATQGPEAGEPEVVCSAGTGGLITSGSGFSGFFSQPSYQSKQVANYLQNGPNLPGSSQYNAQGRSYPDVVAMGHNYPIVVNGGTFVGSGTSCSAPVFAGMVALINGNRLAAGKSSVGFMNPALYKFGETNAAAVFHDITVGENYCTADTCDCDPTGTGFNRAGFNATTGWDNPTGWGSPNFKGLNEAFMNLQ